MKVGKTLPWDEMSQLAELLQIPKEGKPSKNYKSVAQILAWSLNEKLNEAGITEQEDQNNFLMNVVNAVIDKGVSKHCSNTYRPLVNEFIKNITFDTDSILHFYSFYEDLFFESDEVDDEWIDEE